jgi:TonB-dependent starch-binding outer membrane protein SusC
MTRNLLFYESKSGRMLMLTFLLVAFTGMAVFAQNKQITGKVLSPEGTGLPGVSVGVKGTTTGTTTGNDGSFTLEGPADATIVFTIVGYDSKEVKAGAGPLNVTMDRDVKTLDQLVVIGYGTAKRKDLTGSISSVTAAQIEKIPVTSLPQAIQGRAAGVQITNNDGSPGGNISVLIRGVGSLASYGNEPLYVVDGYPIGNGINNINPNDVATIDILKDASATAIYGIRAANGVVIITTKKGRKDGVQVSLDVFNSVQTEPKKYKVLNAQQWATLANEVADADSLHNFVELPIWRTPNALTNVDWQDAIYRTGLTQNYNIAIRGGNEKVQTATSIGYYDQKGIVLGSYFKRLSLGLNLDYTPLKWLKTSTSARYSYQDANNPFGTGNLARIPELPPTLDGGNLKTNLIKDGQGNYGFYNPKSTYVAKYSNPIWSIETNEYENKTNYFLGSTSLEIMPIEGLRLKTNIGVNITSYSRSYFQPEDNRLNEQYNLGGPTQNASYSQGLNQTFEWLWENTISYDKNFGVHGIHFVGGVSAQENTFTQMGGSGIPPNSVIRDLAQVTNLRLDQNGNGKAVYSLASEFARLTYSYNDRYTITGTIRRDGSSKFDESNKYGVFPSGAVAWNISEESFLKNSSWLSSLKLRGSYGEVGNQSSIGLFQYQGLYTTGAAASNSGNLGYPFNKLYQRGYAASQPANPDLKWETDFQTDIGIDGAIMKGDVTFTIDWFKRKSQDFLLTLAAPAQSGYNFLTRNVGSMENKGLEFSVNYNHRKTGAFKWGVGLNLTTIKNRLTSITSGTDFVTNFGGLTVEGQGWGTFTQTNIGQPVGTFYGYQVLGIFQSQAQIDALNAAAKAKDPANLYYQKANNRPGDRYFADLTGDGIVNADDQTSLGSPLPKAFGALNFDGNWKQWDVNILFYGVFGNKIINYMQSALQSFQNRGFVGVQNVSYEYFVNHWTPTNPSNTFARARYNDDEIGSNVPSSAWIEDGTFVKLKNIQIGYTFSDRLTRKITASKVRVYFSTQNVLTFTGYSGLDPEIGIQGGNATQNGVDNGTYPSSRFFTAGFNVTF